MDIEEKEDITSPPDKKRKTETMSEDEVSGPAKKEQSEPEKVDEFEKEKEEKTFTKEKMESKKEGSEPEKVEIPYVTKAKETFYSILDDYEALSLFHAELKNYRDSLAEDEEDSKLSIFFHQVEFHVEQLGKRTNATLIASSDSASDFTTEIFETIQDNYDELIPLRARLEKYMDSLQKVNREDIDIDEYGRLAGLLANVKLRLKQLRKPEMKIFEAEFAWYKHLLNRGEPDCVDFHSFIGVIEQYKDTLSKGNLDDWDEIERLSELLGTVKSQCVNVSDDRPMNIWH